MRAACFRAARSVYPRHPKQHDLLCGGRKTAAGKRFCIGVAAIITAAQHLEPVFEPVIEKAGFKLVRLRVMGGANKTLQIMAERADGSMDVEGCTELSHA